LDYFKHPFRVLRGPYATPKDSFSIYRNLHLIAVQSTFIAGDPQSSTCDILDIYELSALWDPLLTI